MLLDLSGADAIFCGGVGAAARAAATPAAAFWGGIGLQTRRVSNETGKEGVFLGQQEATSSSWHRY